MLSKLDHWLKSRTFVGGTKKEMLPSEQKTDVCFPHYHWPIDTWNKDGYLIQKEPFRQAWFKSLTPKEGALYWIVTNLTNHILPHRIWRYERERKNWMNWALGFHTLLVLFNPPQLFPPPPTTQEPTLTSWTKQNTKMELLHLLIIKLKPTCICIHFSLLRMKVHSFQSKDKYAMDPFLCKIVSFLFRNYILSFTFSCFYAISSPESRKPCRPRPPFNKQTHSVIFHH